MWCGHKMSSAEKTKTFMSDNCNIMRCAKNIAHKAMVLKQAAAPKAWHHKEDYNEQVLVYCVCSV